MSATEETEAEKLRRIALRHIWDKNAHPINRHYGWSDAELDSLIRELREA